MKRKAFLRSWLAVTLALAFFATGCITEVERIVEVPVDPREEFQISFDRDYYLFVGPVGETFNTPGELTVRVTNTGWGTLNNLQIRIQDNSWWHESRDPMDAEADGAGSVFVSANAVATNNRLNPINLGSLASGESATFTVRVPEFSSPSTYWGPSYIEPIYARIQIFNSNITKEFQYIIGSAQTVHGRDFSGLPVVTRSGSIVNNFVVNGMPPGAMDNARFFTDNPGIVRRNGNVLTFTGEGEAFLGFVTGSGRTNNFGVGSPVNDPFILYGSRMQVSPEASFWIESASVIPIVGGTAVDMQGRRGNRILVNFNEPVRSVNPALFAAVVNDRPMLSTQMDLYPRTPILPIYPPDNPRSQDTVVFYFNNAEQMPDGDGRQWALTIGPSADQPGLLVHNRRDNFFMFGDIIRLATRNVGAAVHAESATPLPQINEAIVSNTLQRDRMFHTATSENVTHTGSPPWTDGPTGNRLTLIGTNDGHYLWRQGPQVFINIYYLVEAERTAYENGTITERIFKDGSQYFMQNSLAWIERRTLNTDSLDQSLQGRVWGIILESDQVIDEPGTFPAQRPGFTHLNAHNAFMNSHLMISVVTPEEGTPFNPGGENPGQVTVRWEALPGNEGYKNLRAQRGLTIWIDGKADGEGEGRLVFEAGGNNLNRWVDTDHGGRIVISGGVVFQNANIISAADHHDNNNVSSDHVGIITIGRQGAGGWGIMKNGIIRNNRLESTHTSDSPAHWMSVVAPVSVYGFASAFVMSGGLIENNTIVVNGLQPHSGGIGAGSPQNQARGGHVDEPFLYQNKMVYMTGGIIRNNTVQGGAVMATGGILAAGSFQKTGGIVGPNTVSDRSGSFGGAEIAVLMSPASVFADGSDIRFPNKSREHAAIFSGTAGEDVRLFVDWGSLVDGMFIPSWFSPSAWDD